MKSQTVAEVMRAHGITFRLDVAGLRAWCVKHGKPMPDASELQQARGQFKKRFLRRKVDPQRAGRPRGSRRVKPPREIPPEWVQHYVECYEFARELRGDFAEVGGIRGNRRAARAILQFITNGDACGTYKDVEGSQHHGVAGLPRGVKAKDRNLDLLVKFMRRPQHRVRFLIMTRLRISERTAREILPELRRLGGPLISR